MNLIELLHLQNVGIVINPALSAPYIPTHTEELKWSFLAQTHHGFYVFVVF